MYVPVEGPTCWVTLATPCPWASVGPHTLKGPIILSISLAHSSHPTVPLILTLIRSS